MPRRRTPRQGSMQFWPRKRASSIVARIRHYAPQKETKPNCFAGYKTGMTHIFITDNRQNSLTKGEEICWPVTVVECPPLKIAGARFYTKDAYGIKAFTQIMHDKPDKELSRTISPPKKIKQTFDAISPDKIFDVRLLVHTQPKNTTIGKKKPELFEITLGGTTADKITYAKNNLGKEIKITDAFTEGQQVDTHSISKGKGYQGPVKRFGINIRSHKSEKTKRGPGNVGSWTGNRSSPVPHAGQMGFHQRIEYNKQILKISDENAKINPKGGFLRYGETRNTYLLLKGSVPGPAKRLIKMTPSIRADKKVPKDAPQITFISTASKQ